MKYVIPTMASLLVLNTSCSWYRDMERSLVKDEEKQDKKSRYVPREQYEQLLAKYEDLSKKYELSKEAGTKDAPTIVEELGKTQSENFANTSPNVETVSINPPEEIVTSVEVPTDLESQLALYRRGLSLKASNPAEATKIFQQLELQGAPAVKVRARFQMGEMLFEKQQFDLALQVFEDIINKNAYSGVVLEALRFASVCSEKLGIQNKKEQYTSMLNDVFETH